MSIYQKIKSILSDQLQPHILEINNESYKHLVPRDAETHWQITIVSDKFIDLSRIKRHKLVHSMLKDVLDNIHALSLALYTSDEWSNKKTNIPKTPPCANRKQ